MKLKIIPNEQTPEIVNYKPLYKLLYEDYDLLVKFISFARTRHNCVGLASNQCSARNKRIMEPFFAIRDERNRWDIIIHPQIVKYGGKKKLKEEGCLTWIGKTIIAERYPWIDVKYFTLNGNLIEETLSGFKAQVFQHEYNHLKGINENVVE